MLQLYHPRGTPPNALRAGTSPSLENETGGEAMIELVKVALKKGMVDITEEQRVALKEEIADILKEFGTAKSGEVKP